MAYFYENMTRIQNEDWWPSQEFEADIVASVQVYEADILKTSLNLTALELKTGGQDNLVFSLVSSFLCFDCVSLREAIRQQRKATPLTPFAALELVSWLLVAGASTDGVPLSRAKFLELYQSFTPEPSGLTWRQRRRKAKQCSLAQVIRLWYHK